MLRLAWSRGIVGISLEGGLVRSLGGWAEVERLRLKGQVHIKSDERILGNSDFVDSVLGQAEEHYERQCALKRQGYPDCPIPVHHLDVCESQLKNSGVRPL